MRAKLVAAKPLLHSADIPWMGFDIFCEVPPGKLYVQEANAIGAVRKFYYRQVADDGFPVDEQFDGLRSVAYRIAE